MAGLYLTCAASSTASWPVRPPAIAVARDGGAALHRRSLSSCSPVAPWRRRGGPAAGARGQRDQAGLVPPEQALATTAVDVLGLGALDGSGDRRSSSRSLTIAGGTTEVNKNIIAERVLGLPRGAPSR